MRKLGESQQKSKNRKAAPTRTKKKSMQLKGRVRHVWKINRSREICSRKRESCGGDGGIAVGEYGVAQGFFLDGVAKVFVFLNRKHRRV